MVKLSVVWLNFIWAPRMVLLDQVLGLQEKLINWQPDYITNHPRIQQLQTTVINLLMNLPCGCGLVGTACFCSTQSEIIWRLTSRLMADSGRTQASGAWVAEAPWKVSFPLCALSMWPLPHGNCRADRYIAFQLLHNKLPQISGLCDAHWCHSSCGSSFEPYNVSGSFA